MVAFEAGVAGGIPIIKAIREGLAGNRIEWLAGIINGTGNFILTEMRDAGRNFADVLLEAQALGYAEADPAFDVEGVDAAHKLAILAAIAFGHPLQFDAVRRARQVLKKWQRKMHEDRIVSRDRKFRPRPTKVRSKR